MHTLYPHTGIRYFGEGPVTSFNEDWVVPARHSSKPTAKLQDLPKKSVTQSLPQPGTADSVENPSDNISMSPLNQNPGSALNTAHHFPGLSQSRACPRRKTVLHFLHPTGACCCCEHHVHRSVGRCSVSQGSSVSSVTVGVAGGHLESNFVS